MDVDNKRYTVYIHTNKINNKCYVGITSKVNVVRRWGVTGNGYLNKDKNGKFCQPKFARAIIKYGWDNFDHIIWAENLTYEEACYAERILILFWDSINNGYNITFGGGGSVGRVCSDDTKRRISESQTGKSAWNKGIHGLQAGSNHPRARKVIRLCDKKVFDYLTKASQETGINRLTLTTMCKQHREWMYLDEYELFQIVH